MTALHVEQAIGEAVDRRSTHKQHLGEPPNPRARGHSHPFHALHLCPSCAAGPFEGSSGGHRKNVGDEAGALAGLLSTRGVTALVQLGADGAVDGSSRLPWRVLRQHAASQSHCSIAAFAAAFKMAALGDVLHRTFVTILFTGSVLGAVGLGAAMVQRFSFHRGAIEVVGQGGGGGWGGGGRWGAAAGGGIIVGTCTAADDSSRAPCRSSLIPQQQQPQQSPRTRRRVSLVDVVTSLPCSLLTAPSSALLLAPPSHCFMSHQCTLLL